MNIANKFRDLYKQSNKKSSLKWGLTAFAAILFLGLISVSFMQPASQGEGSSLLPLVDQVSSVAKFIVKFLIVILIIYMSFNLFQRWQTGEVAHQKSMTVVETLHLSPQRALYIVKIDQKTMVIGATDQNINLLSSSDDQPVDDNNMPSKFSLNQRPRVRGFDTLDQYFEEIVERR